MSRLTKPILWIVMLCCLSLCSIAQHNNNIFNGGTNDGYHDDYALQLSGNAIFIGSGGDGYDLNSFFPTVGNNLFAGGVGDGFDHNFYLQPTSNMVFSGSDGDGHDLSAYIQNVNNGIYAGAEGDGFDLTCYIQSTNTNIFAGGPGDGHDFSQYIQLSSNAIFSGGVGDGFDFYHYLQLSSNAIYSGGSGDGFDKDQGYALPCSVDSLTLFAQSCEPGDTGIIVLNLMNFGGCDSVVTTITSLINAYSTTIPIVSCNVGDTGVFVQNLTAKNGCDSTVTTVVSFDPGSQTNLPGVSVCEGDSLYIFGEFRNSAGIYYDTIPNQNGCDSILALTLAFNPIDTTLLNSITNDSSMAGVVITILSNQAGCDSVVITTIAYDPDSCIIDSTFINVVTCDSSLAGISVQTFVGTNLCDSVVITTTTFDPGSITVLADIEICQGDTAVVFGNHITVAGSYFDTIPNQNSCDSVITVSVTVNPTYIVIQQDSICVGDSLFAGGAYQQFPGVYMDELTTTKGCDSLVQTILYYKDSTLCDSVIPTKLSIVSDSGWTLSTEVTSATANSYPWPGVGSHPPLVTFTLPAIVGQPYPWTHLYTVSGSQVIKSGSGVTYYRRSFDLTDHTALNARFRMFVDDDMEIFINGKSIALEVDMGMQNWRTANHDILFNDDGSVVNPNAGGDPFDYYSALNLDSVFKTGSNDVVLAIRNRTSKPDVGGFSFRLDLDKGGNPVIVDKVTPVGPEVSRKHIPQITVYPNPTADVVSIVVDGIRDGALLEMNVYDVSGKLLITTERVYKSKEETQLNLSGLASGVYTLKVKAGNIEITKAVMVK